MIRKVRLKTEEGQVVDAIAPVVITASRTTDVPAYYVPWFFRRLEKGYASWISPYTRRPVYVSFEDVRVVVFWTKDPAPMMPFLSYLDERGIHYYFQYTLNDYRAEHIEPWKPTLDVRIGTFRELSEQIGRARVIWRYDPIIFCRGTTAESTCQRIENIARRLKGFTERLVISFLDTGPRLERRMRTRMPKLTVGYDYRKMRIVAQRLRALQAEMETDECPFSISTCAEEIDLHHYGIAHGKCVDDQLMARLWPDDPRLMDFLRRARKDKGQRRLCQCIESKDIGAMNTCPRGCLYCYATTDAQTLKHRVGHHDPRCEHI